MISIVKSSNIKVALFTKHARYDKHWNLMNTVKNTLLEVLTAVTMRSIIFWIVTQCSINKA
jgi:hypothetical protein